jgi:hypothetical protein
MYYQEEARGLEQLLATAPDQRGWQYRRAENLTFQYTVLAVTGRVKEARQLHAEAMAIMRKLVASGGAAGPLAPVAAAAGTARP